jgi:capsular polysaccharide biosynthesis protein
MNWLRGKLLAGFPKEVAQRRRLYISRSDSNRRVSNEEEIFRFLESQGFEKLIMSQLTPGEQIDAFRAAEIIVLPHGAAGANLVFVPLDCRVIELHSPRWLNSCYMCLCSTLGIGYDWLMGNQMGSDMDYKVDLQKLNQILESF